MQKPFVHLLCVMFYGFVSKYLACNTVVASEIQTLTVNITLMRAATFLQ